MELESKGVDTCRSKDESKSIDFAEESLEGTSLEAPVAPTIFNPLVGIKQGLVQKARNEVPRLRNLPIKSQEHDYLVDDSIAGEDDSPMTVEKRKVGGQ